MKKLIITLSILLLASTKCFAAIPNFVWTATVAANWSAMVSANNTYWQRLQAETATNPSICSYDDMGWREAVMYKITGTASYADAAAVKAAAYAPTDAGANGRNETRDRYARLVAICDMVCDGASAGNKSALLAALDVDFAKVTGQAPYQNHGTRCNVDTDECVGHYFGAVANALLYANDNPTKMNNMLNYVDATYGSIGGVTSTGDNHNTWRNSVYHWIHNLATGGTWMESSDYNMGTPNYVNLGVFMINNYYGVDKFPEWTALYDDIASYRVNSMTSNVSDFFKWGDTQSNSYNGNKKFEAMTIYAQAAFFDNDVNARYMLNLINSSSGSACMRSDYFLYLDDTDTKTAPSGQTDWFASGMGEQYWNSDHTSTNSMYIAQFEPPTYADHELDDFANWGLYRSNQRSITNVRNYSPYPGSPYLNAVYLYGSLQGFKEAKGYTFEERGSNYAAIGGVTGGIYHSAGTNDPFPDIVREYDRQQILFHNTDNSDTVVIFDRIEACKPTDSACINFSTPAAKLARLDNTYESRMLDLGYKHQWVLNTNTLPVQSGDTFTWTTLGGENAKLYTFIPSYTVATPKVSDYKYITPYYFNGNIPASNSEYDKYQLRLAVTTNTGYTRTAGEFMTWVNVVQVGGTMPTVTQINVTTGAEDVKGALVDLAGEKKLALFNAQQDTTTTFTSDWWGSDVNYQATYDPLRFQKTRDMAEFKTGNTISVTLSDTENLDVFIINLDTTKSWTFQWDGGAQTCSVSANGICHFQKVAPSAAAHTISWTSTGSVAGCDDDCSLCTINQAQCEASALTCYWHNNDGSTSYQCNALQQDSTLCAAGDFNHCLNETNCVNASFCWDDTISTCLADCSSGGTGSTAQVTPSADIKLTQGSSNQDTLGLGASAGTTATSYGATGSGGVSDNNTKAISVTVDSCSNRILVVSITCEESLCADPTALTVGATSILANKVGSPAAYWFATGKHIMYYMLNPSSGAQTVTATFTAANPIDQTVSAAVVCGVKQQAPEASCTGTDSCSINTLTSGAVLVSSIGNISNDTNTVTGGVTQSLVTGSISGDVISQIGAGIAGAAGTYTCGYTNTQTGDKSGTTCAAFEKSGSGSDITSCMRFDLSAITAGSTINSATLNMYTTGSATVGGTINLFKGLRNWTENQATFADYSSGNAWTTAGARGNGTDITGDYTVGTNYLATYATTGTETNGGKITFTNNPDGSLATYLETNFGGTATFCLQQESGESPAGLTTYDSENATQKPYLEINYDTSTAVEGTSLRTFNGGLYYGTYK